MPAWALSLLLNRYTLGALAFALAAGGVWWWHSARVSAFEKAIDARWEARLAAAQEGHRRAISGWVVEMVERQQKTAQDRARAAAERRAVFAQLEKEVPAYVTPLADSRCVVPSGFVWHHDAAAAARPATVPESAGGLVDADSGIALSAVEATVTGNYATCHELLAEVEAWRAWYAMERAAWERLRQELAPSRTFPSLVERD